MWRPGVEENLGYYVYLLIDPLTDIVFYVGKGLGWRCFAHVREARKTTSDSKGDYQKLATIRAIEDAGQEVRIDLLGMASPRTKRSTSSRRPLTCSASLT